MGQCDYLRQALAAELTLQREALPELRDRFRRRSWRRDEQAVRQPLLATARQ